MTRYCHVKAANGYPRLVALNDMTDFPTEQGEQISFNNVYFFNINAWWRIDNDYGSPNCIVAFNQPNSETTPICEASTNTGYFYINCYSYAELSWVLSDPDSRLKLLGYFIKPGSVIYENTKYTYIISSFKTNSDRIYPCSIMKTQININRLVFTR